MYIQALSSWDYPVLSFFGAFINAYIITLFIILGILAAVMHVFNAIALFELAKRRGVRYYGLSWVPVGNFWVTGCLADGFDNATKGYNNNLRGKLLWISLAVHCALLTFIFASIAFWGVAILLVFYLAAIYKIYNSCRDKDNLMGFCASAVFPVIIPFKLFAMRELDEGFPFIKEQAKTDAEKTRYSDWVVYSKTDTPSSKSTTLECEPIDTVQENSDEIVNHDSCTVPVTDTITTDQSGNFAEPCDGEKSGDENPTEGLPTECSDTDDFEHNLNTAHDDNSVNTIAPDDSEPRPLTAPKKDDTE